MKSYFPDTIGMGILAIAAAPLFAFAVGGGGGGSVPSCSQDTWSCTEWSACSTAGTQARTCTLTFDCPSADTPKSNEEQSCTPPPPVPTPTPAPAPAPSPIPEAAPAKTPPLAPVCTKDTWTCTAWSLACDINGLENRSCKLSFDCSSAATPPPEESRPCRHLQCGEKPTLHERILCRLNLSNAGIIRELQIQYLPEECRAMRDRSEKSECIATYRSYAPCWAIPPGEPRFTCARNILKLGPVISDEVKTCQGKTGKGQAACKEALRDRVFYMVKFRFYDLEQRAEDLARRGANLDAVAKLETAIERKKQALDGSKTDGERRQIVLDVRAAWRDFIANVKDEVK